MSLKGEVKMNIKRLLQSKRKGSTIVLVMIVLVILLLAGAGLLNLGLQSRLAAVRDASEISARCAADAGLAKALYEMNQKLEGGGWSDSNLPYATYEPLPGCDATFGYTVTPEDSNSTTTYTIDSSGSSGASQRSVSADLRVKGLFDNAILVMDRMALMPNITVKGLNSMDAGDTDFDVKIGTLSVAEDRITLGPGAVVEGDAFVGVGGDPAYTMGAGGTVTGNKYALIEEPPTPVITAPAMTDMGTSLSIMANTTIGPSANGKYTGFNVNGSTTLTVGGGDVVLDITGNVTIGNSAIVALQAGSTLTVYINGTLIMNNGSGFLNDNPYCGTLKIFSTTTEDRIYDMKAKSKVFGVIYAPTADLALYSGAEVVGSIVCNFLDMKSGGTFYYDEALRNVTPYEEGTYFVVERWSEQQ